MYTRGKEVCKALKYNKKTAHLSVENDAHKYDLSKWSAADHLLNWPPDSRKLRSKVSNDRYTWIMYACELAP